MKLGAAFEVAFEVALTQRARLAVPGLAPDERAAAEEADTVLARLGVVAVPDVPLP